MSGTSAPVRRRISSTCAASSAWPSRGDPEAYCFERGLSKTGSAIADGRPRTDGFADVWLKGHFAWEYKAPGRSLEGALKQLMI
jgi:hypothetical protein